MGKCAKLISMVVVFSNFQNLSKIFQELDLEIDFPPGRQIKPPEMTQKYGRAK